MSRENQDGLRRVIDAFNRTGAFVIDRLAPDFELHQASSIIDTAGVFRGPDAFRDSLLELQTSFDDLTFEAEEFHEAPGDVLVVFVRVRGRGRGSNLQIDNQVAWVITFREGLATRLVVYEEPGEALEAAGLRE